MTVLILSRQREFKLLKLVLLLAGLHKVQPCRYCFYSVVSSPKIGFSPRRVTHCPDKREIWHEVRAKFHIYWGRNVGIQPQNCQNFEF